MRGEGAAFLRLSTVEDIASAVIFRALARIDLQLMRQGAALCLPE